MFRNVGKKSKIVSTYSVASINNGIKFRANSFPSVIVVIANRVIRFIGLEGVTIKKYIFKLIRRYIVPYLYGFISHHGFKQLEVYINQTELWNK